MTRRHCLKFPNLMRYNEIFWLVSRHFLQSWKHQYKGFEAATYIVAIWLSTYWGVHDDMTSWSLPNIIHQNHEYKFEKSKAIVHSRSKGMSRSYEPVLHKCKMYRCLRGHTLNDWCRCWGRRRQRHCYNFECWIKSLLTNRIY